MLKGDAAPADQRKPLGRRGEDLVAAHVEGQGWHVVARNWRPSAGNRHGEVDIIAQDGEWLVFVEVRTRSVPRGAADPTLGPPENSITPRKQLQLAQLASAYLMAISWPGSWRIDVFALELRSDGAIHRLAHFRDAVGA